MVLGAERSDTELLDATGSKVRHAAGRKFFFEIIPEAGVKKSLMKKNTPKKKSNNPVC